MSNEWKKLDPNIKEEQKKYTRPVPSRSFILQHLKNSPAPARHEMLCAAFGIAEEEDKKALKNRLQAMVRDGQILKTRKNFYGHLDKMHLIPGLVQGHKEGYGFLIPEDGGDDIFLNHYQMRQVFDGDRVAVGIAGKDRKGRKEGNIYRVLSRNTTQLIGRFQEKNETAWLIPESKRIHHEIILKPSPLKPTTGQYVLVDILEQPSTYNPAVGLVKEILGSPTTAGLEIEVAIRNHCLPHEWPQAVKKESATLSTTVAKKDKDFRVDLRDLPFVTIDGSDAQDFDDAVYCEKNTRGFRLFVAIADVSHYVQVGSELDKEAANRGNSVYFPGHVIPMLPETLSNKLCSLQPQVDRLAMVCEIQLGKTAKPLAYYFYEAVIHSKQRLTYEEADQIFLGTPRTDLPRNTSWLKALSPLYKLYQALVKQRIKRGALDFETTETQIIFGTQRKIDRIVAVKRLDAHRVIEECMLLANACTAQFLAKYQLPILYRVHAKPKPEKLLALKQFLGELGLTLSLCGIPKSADYQKLLENTHSRADHQVIQTMLLRSMNQAIYDSENKGHFGLSYAHYTHFTSPIRRYSDLLIHRAIRYIIRCRKNSPFYQVCEVKRHKSAPNIAKYRIYPYNTEKIKQLGEHCSTTERRADDATREAVNWLKCEYMQQHIGSNHTGIITGVTHFGLFVELENIYVEGLIHISTLPSDYYQYQPNKQRLVGERSGRAFHLGAVIKVIVTHVNLDERKIDFELSEERKPLSKDKKTKKKSKGTEERATKVPKTTRKKQDKIKKGTRSSTKKSNQAQRSHANKRLINKKNR